MRLRGGAGLAEVDRLAKRGLAGSRGLPQRAGVCTQPTFSAPTREIKW